MTTDAVTDFEVEGDRLEVVKDFVLLGSQVNEDARSRPEGLHLAGLLWATSGI